MIPTMNTQAIGSEWVGRLIDGKYPLLQWLGGSGQSGVFLTDLQESQWPRAAIKLLPAADPIAETRFAGWMTAITLSHPNLMPLLACGRCSNGDTKLIYSVTPFSEELLSQILAERPLIPAEVEDLLKPVIDALLYLHGRGFVHGHLKPSNLMVLDGQVKLSSDSLEAVGGSAAHHKPANVYDAPERDRKTITPAADVWSLGITLVEALTQRPPAWKPSMTRAPVVPKAVPEPWADIARECLRRGPANRCTVSEIQLRLIPALPSQIEPSAETAIAPEPVAESAEETPAEARIEPASETVPEPITETATESAFETTTGTPEEATPEPATATRIESAPETAPESADEAVTEPPAEPLPEFVPQAVTLPEPPPARFPINTQNVVLLGVLGLIAFLALLFNLRPSTTPAAAPARNEPQPPAASAPAASPGTVPGEVVHKVMPDVPPADRAKISGTIEVKVLVTVDPNGQIDDAILNVPGPSPSLATLAQKTSQKWSFKPALVQGRPVSSYWVLEFQFNRGSTRVIPFEVSP